MVDNVAITAGAGTTVATDDVGGVHYQKMKLFDGTADSEAAIPGDATYGLDVDVTRLPALAAGANLVGKIAAGLDTTNLYDGATALTISRAAISKNGSGANELVAADATKKIRVLALMLYAVGTANSAYLASAATAIFGGSSAAFQLDKLGVAGSPGFCLAFNPAGWCETAVNEALNLYLSAAQYVGGVLVYTKL